MSNKTHIPADTHRPGAGRAWPAKTATDARRIVAEDVLIVAERLGHRALTTGHVLIAILERPDEYTSDIISSVPGIREVTAVIDALPGQEDT